MAKKNTPKEKPKQEAGAPAWMVTYGDMMTLLLCFFVILVAMSEIKEDKKYEDVVRSIQEAFGFVGGIGTVPMDQAPRMSMMDKSQESLNPNEPGRIGDSNTPGLDGKTFRVTQVREGVEIAYGGRISFDRSLAELRPEALEQIEMLAERLRGHNTKIDVRGHAAAESVPAGSPYRDLFDLSYARARSVAEALIAAGVRKNRIRLVAAGASEPLKDQAYDEGRRSANRRAEIVVRESLVTDYAGDKIHFEEQ